MRPYLKNTQYKKGLEDLPSKCETLSSRPVLNPKKADNKENTLFWIFPENYAPL
jgi:hypothetical protein